MDEDDRAALWAAMYDQEDEDKPVGKSKPNEVVNAALGLRKARRVVMGAVAYEVPTMEYVESLEQRVNQQEKIIREQFSRLRRLETILSSVQGTLRKNNNIVMDVRSSLDNKLDRRDLS